MAWAATADKGTVVTAGVAAASVVNDGTHGTFTTGAWSVGDRIVVNLNANGMTSASATVAITDSLGNSYAEDSALAGSTTERGAVLSANVTVAGTPTSLTATLSAGSAFVELTWARYTGLNTAAGAAAAVDVSIVARATAGTAASGNTASTTAANELVI